MINALSVDVEEYFHAEVFSGVVDPRDWSILESRVAGATERILEILAAAGTRGTFFVLGWVAERQPGLVRAIHAEGHEVACHGYGHRMITRQDRKEFAEDVRRAREILEDTTGARVIGYRAPTFSVVRDTLWSLDVLAEGGFEYDSSIYPILHDRYGIPDAPRFPHWRAVRSGGRIAEFPLSTVSVKKWRLPVAGGGYFRLLPYGVTRWALNRLNGREGQPGIVYLHPWEMDPEQPRMGIGRWSQWRHSVNLATTVGKLRRLVREFRFAPVREVLGGCGVLTVGAQ